MSDRSPGMPFQQTEPPSGVQTKFSPQERKIWSLCDGEHAVTTIATGVEMPADVIEHILKVWAEQGWIGWVKADAASTTPVEQTMDAQRMEKFQRVSTRTPNSTVLPAVSSPSSQTALETIITASLQHAGSQDDVQEIEMFEVEILDNEDDVVVPAASSASSVGSTSTPSIAAFQSVSARGGARQGISTLTGSVSPAGAGAQTPTATVKTTNLPGSPVQPAPVSAPPTAPAFSPGFMAVVQNKPATEGESATSVVPSPGHGHKTSVPTSRPISTHGEIVTSVEAKKRAEATQVEEEGKAEKANTTTAALKIPGAGSGRWPKPGESMAAGATLSPDTIVVGRGHASESLRGSVGGTSQQHQPTLVAPGGAVTASSTVLKIPGAASGSATMAGSDLTSRIPGASSMYSQPNDATQLHVVGQGTGAGHNLAASWHNPGARVPGELAANLVENRGASTSPTEHPSSEFPSQERRPLARGMREERLAISKEERDIFEEAVWEAAHDEVREVRDKVIATREVVTSLSRVIRTLQLYDVNNTAVRDALSTLFKQLMSFMHEFNSMILAVEPWVMTMDGQAVYTNEDRDYNLAFKLYRDGVRGLQIHRGVNWEELAQFLKILGTRYSGALVFEDDVATMFRKANLRFISVVAIEGFGFERYEDGGKANIEKLFERMEKYDPSDIWERPEQPDDPIRLRGGARGAVLSTAVREENAQGILREIKSRPIEANAMADTVCLPLLHENHSEFLSEQIVRLFRYIDKVVLDLSTVTGLDGIRHLLREFRNVLMAEGHPDGLKEFLTRVDRWTKLVDSRGRLLAPLAQEMLDSFDDEEVMRRWITSSHIRDEQEHFYPSVFEILQWEGKDRRQVLIQILAHEKAPRLKQTIRHMLVQMGGADISLYVQQLREADGPLALELIDCLHEIGTVEAIELIGSMIEDADPMVQDKVIGLAEQLFSGPENFAAIRGVMEHLLASEHEHERMRAYRLIEAAEDRRWLSILRKELQSKRDRSDQEIMELARLVARLDPKAILPSLLEWAEPPGMLSIERQWRKQLRLGSVAALGQVGGREAEKAVRDLMEQADGTLHAACLDAMREMRRHQGESKPLPKRLQGSKENIDLAMLESSATQDKKAVVADIPEEDHELHRLHDMMAKSLQHIDLKSENEFASLIREHGHKWILSFHMLIKNRGLYDANNEIFIRPLEEVTKSMEKLLEHNTVVSVVGLEGQFYINNVRIRSSSESSQQIFAEFFRTLQRLKMGGISFSFPMNAEEWSFLVELFAGQGQGAGCRDWKSIGTELNAHGLNRYIEVFGPLHTVLSGERQRRGVRPLSEIFMEGCDVVEDAWYFAVRGQVPNPQPIRRLIHDLIETLVDGRIRDLSVLAFEDPAEPMKTHWLQVTLLSLLIGHEIGLEAEQLADLGMSAFFHDIGHSVFIDPEVRRGEGWQALNHQQAGMALLLKHRGFNEGKIKRLLTIQEHHLNATPVSSQPVPVLYSRIVRIADVYDTLCSALCGGVPLCPTDALERMSSGCPKLFDPALMQALINRVGHYPPGTIVMLNDDTVAISLGHKADTQTFDRPSLILVRDRRGREVSEQIIDLSHPQYERSKILGIVPNDPWLEPKKRVIRRLWPRIAAVLEAKAAAFAATQQKSV